MRMPRLHHLPFVLISLVWLQSTHAQDRASVYYRFEPSADLDQIGPAGDITTHNLSARMGYPVINSENMTVIPGVDFAWDHFDFNDFPVDDLDTYNVGLGVTMIYSGFENRKIITRLAPGISSDFKTITDDDFRLFGMILGVQKLSETFSIGLGVIYNQDFGDPRIYPGLGFNWQISDLLELDMNMPRPRILYTPNDQTRFALHAAPAGDSWSIEHEGEDLELTLENIRIGGEVERKVAKHFWLALDLGINVDRSYEVEHEDGRNIIDAGADSVPYVRVGLVYR
jgi:hypothetical protein